MVLDEGYENTTYAYLNAILSLIISEVSHCKSGTLQFDKDIANCSAGSPKL
jgi:hypothetical protein